MPYFSLIVSLKTESDSIIHYNNDNLEYENNNIIANNYNELGTYSFIIFLKHLGIHEYYLFGWYFSEKLLNISNYNFYDDLIVNQNHFYNKKKSIKEAGVFMENMMSHFLGITCKRIYNVTSKGSVSDKIMKIDYEDIGNENKTAKYFSEYDDIVEQYGKVDFDYFYKTYCIFPTISGMPSYIANMYNFSNSTNHPLFFKNIHIKLMCAIFAFACGYPSDVLKLLGTCCDIFMTHYVLKFNEIMQIDFINDFDKLNDPTYFDNLNDPRYLQNSNNKYLSAMIEYLKHIDISTVTIEKYKNLIHYVCHKIYVDYLPEDFDLYLYKEINSYNDMDDYTALGHYILTGKNENKHYKYENTPIDFDPIIYKELNPDLFKLSNSQAKNHYETEGYKEDRKYKYENTPANFDSIIYKELNPDLSKLSDLEAKKHYEIEGYKEDRKYKYNNVPTDFDPSVYKELNPDLISLTILEAKKHYETDGHKEDRKYKYNNVPTDFDPSVYKELNPDLISLTILEAKKHYETDGYAEDRKYKM